MVDILWFAVCSCLNSILIIDTDCDVKEDNFLTWCIDVPLQDAKVIDIAIESVPCGGIVKVIPRSKSVVNESTIVQKMTFVFL